MFFGTGVVPPRRPPLRTLFLPPAAAASVPPSPPCHVKLTARHEKPPHPLSNHWPTLTIQLRLRALPPLAGPRPPALVLLQLALLDLPFCSLLRPFILPFTYSSTFYPFSAIYPIREGSITRFHLRCPPPCRLCLPFCCSPLLAPLLLLTPSSPRATSPELGQ